MEYQKSASEIIILQAQVISSYCKTFNPTQEQIDEIIKYYIVDKYEKVKLVIKDNIVYIVSWFNKFKRGCFIKLALNKKVQFKKNWIFLYSKEIHPQM